MYFGPSGSSPSKGNVFVPSAQALHSKLSWGLPAMQGLPERRPSDILGMQGCSLHAQSSPPCKPAIYRIPAGVAERQAAVVVRSPGSPILRDLSEGAEITLQREGGELLRFRCKSVLGEGSFSKVWLAEGIDETGRASSESVALKDMYCTTEASFQQVLLEIEVLEWSSKASLEAVSGSPAPRTPRCVAYQIDRHAHGWRARMAMTRVPGDTLEAFMLRSPPPGQDFAIAVQRGCALAAQLLRQLAPTLEALSHKAWHRDINPRNIMVSDALDGVIPERVTCHPQESGSRASFWLIDFGLAARSSTWVAPESRWITADLAGDCRYWPQSTWFKFLHGEDALAAHADLCNQYQTRLDIHGLGLVALELLCATAAGGDRSFSASFSDSQTAAWSSLLAAWRKYQRNAKAWHEKVFQVFRGGDDVHQVQTRLRQDGVSSKVMELMRNLRCSLQTCALESADLTMKVLLQSIAQMIDEGSRFGLQDVSCSLQVSDLSQRRENTRRTVAVEVEVVSA